MKPKKLTLKNFGPFIDETIDFSKLTDAPLFLITGKTGAGKTTIFDGMTYALFGETSGKIRSAKEMRSLFATPEEETSVLFSFEHQQMSYEIERKPEQVLAKRKGNGNRKQAAKVSLTIFDAKGKEVKQYTKRSEVDQLIKELLNLDAKQFSQIVLLPQGEFRNFLISSSSEKEGVLRNLFGSQFFQQFNEQLKEKAKLQQQKLDHLEQELTLLRKRFVMMNEEPTENVSYEETIALWQLEQTALEEIILAEKAKLLKLQEQQKQIENDYYRSESLNKSYKEKTRLIQRKKELDEKETVIAEKRQWIKQYEFAQKLQDTIARSHEYVSDQLEMATKERAYFEQLTHKEQLYKKWLEQEEERMALQKKIDGLSKDFQEKKILLPIADQWQQKQVDLKELQEEEQALKEKKRVISQEEAQILLEQQKIQEQLAEQEELQENRLHYEKLRQEHEKHQEMIEQWNEKKEQIESYRVQLNEIKSQFEANQEYLSQQTELLDRLKSQWASQQIARLQLLLLPGQPCPVCGATEHPNQQDQHELPEKEEIVALEQKLAQTESVIDQIHQEIGRNEADRTKISEQLIKLTEWCSAKREEIAKNEEILKTKIKKTFRFAKVSDLVVSLKEIDRDLTAQISVIAQAKKAQQEILEKLPEITDRLKEIGQYIDQNKEKIQQTQGESASLTKQLEKIDTHTLSADVKYLEEQIASKTQRLSKEMEQGLSYSQEINLLKTQLDTIHEQQKKNDQKLESVQEKISEKMKEQDYFKETEEILSFVQQEEVYNEAVQTTDAYEEERLIVEDRLAQLATISLEEELQDLNDLKEQLERIKEEVTKQQESCYRWQEQKNQNQQIIEEFSSIYQTSQKQLDELIELQQLAQTINGENPRKTSLERYVLQVYLQEVLQVANSQLQRLTKNRYQFELAEEVGSYRGKTGLEINIYDDEAGMSRGAHTLSGGESFIAALSLALALAEVIQAQTGGVTIEALFIDEGFGSLDEEALEMAIEALETIESEGRMIGIISHVRELKERVVQQIRISTEGSGQSKVRYHLG